MGVGDNPKISVGRARTGLGGGRQLPPGARLLERQARPLTGAEIGAAIREHVKQLMDSLFRRNEIETSISPIGSDLYLKLDEEVARQIALQSQLNRKHLVYPYVCWRIRVFLEKVEGCSEDAAGWNLWAELQVDLERNRQLNFVAGTKGLGEVVGEEEDEQLQTRTPDAIRGERGLKVEAEYLTQDGQIGHVEIGVEKVKRPIVEAQYPRPRPEGPVGDIGQKSLSDSEAAIEALEKELAARQARRAEKSQEEMVGELHHLAEGLDGPEDHKNQAARETEKAAELPVEDIAGNPPEMAKGQIKPQVSFAKRTESKKGLGGGK